MFRFKVAVGLKPTPAVTGREMGYTLDGSPVDLSARRGIIFNRNITFSMNISVLHHQ